MNPLKAVQKFYPEVQRVVDAKKSVPVNVEWWDHQRAVRQDPARCALARAAQRDKNLDGALVSKTIVYLIDGEVATRYAVKPNVTKQIAKFDRLADFEPGVYTLHAPSPQQRLGTKRPKWEPKPHQRSHKPLRRVNGIGRHPLSAKV